jgi:hypothetical protein
MAVAQIGLFLFHWVFGLIMERLASQFSKITNCLSLTLLGPSFISNMGRMSTTYSHNPSSPLSPDKPLETVPDT